MYIEIASISSEVNIYIYIHAATYFNKYWIWSSTILKVYHMELGISHHELFKKKCDFIFLFELWEFSVLCSM